MMQPSGRKTVREQWKCEETLGHPGKSVNGDVRMRAYRNQDKGGGHLHITGDSGKEWRKFGDSSIPGEKGLDEDEMTMAGLMAVRHSFRCGRMHP